MQKFLVSQPERDWRYVTYVLPVQYLQLSASESKGNVQLNWGVTASLALQNFEIQRSTDNIRFTTVATQVASSQVDVLKNYADFDNISSVNSQMVYYRIKVIAVNGQEKYSNVAPVRKTTNRTAVIIAPNPANEVASLRFYAEKETQVTITIKDITGRVIAMQKVKAFKGNNNVPMNGLSKYSDGVYNVQLLVGNEVFTTKLIIQN